MSQRGVTSTFGGLCWPACRRSAPAKAIIAPLSVHSAGRGKQARPPRRSAIWSTGSAPETIARELARRGRAHGVPLGFSNSYALATAEALAGQRGLRRISDLLETDTEEGTVARRRQDQADGRALDAGRELIATAFAQDDRVVVAAARD